MKMKYLYKAITIASKGSYVAAFIFFFQVIYPSNANADVLCVQEFLSKTVFSPGVVDGQWGKKTNFGKN